MPSWERCYSSPEQSLECEDRQLKLASWCSRGWEGTICFCAVPQRQVWWHHSGQTGGCWWDFTESMEKNVTVASAGDYFVLSALFWKIQGARGSIASIWTHFPFYVLLWWKWLIRGQTHHYMKQRKLHLWEKQEERNTKNELSLYGSRNSH